MAELERIQAVLEEFQTLRFYKARKVEATRQREYMGAVRLQSWFRGFRVRFYIRHLHEKAVIIQKIWRGFRARARYRQMVMEAYFIMKTNFYNEMAIRIQRRWRGFFVRKYIHSFYSRKSYLEKIARTNGLVRREMDELEELQKRERLCLLRVKEQRAKLYQAYRWHHLLSTEQRRGVFNSPFRTAPHEMELLLRQVKYQAPTKVVPQDYAHLTPAAPTLPSFYGSIESPRKTLRACCSPKPVLPRIGSTKQKVRIRDPEQMWEQSGLVAESSVGLHTSCAHLEETQNRLRLYSSTLRYMPPFETQQQ
ncbi:spermatogenesis-associated protein 17 isoform X1 [Syngnathus scovelli]|uniref:spermatogenesis-associated protein 17 isoform X1 n=1 Tax=Syngnathus scovelli TaxID=161590 RepID=UPI00210FDD17|nr:spermatogenesis-associated protein 17 isoform X1 [Syngnathus scovelli]XP_049574228.1 spermatogenesis-associated protein 17 isoform X1 [Syngnathus scovelli]XP_049574229.1 spermatogenesis-associated protein 17 isoform X1 [Syngnathus scovelli]